MKVKFTLNESLSFEFDATNTKEAFEQIADVTDVFDNAPKNGGKVKYRIRKVTKDKKEYTYYEAIEGKTNGRLAYGVYQDNSGLFPKKRNNETGEWYENNGYVVYHKEESTEPVKV